MQKQTFTLPLDNGTTLSVETGRLAPQTNGSCLVSIGETSVLATACMGRKPENVDFLPLSVSYQEKFYASGLMKHSKINKREGRPPDEKILMGRVIDRGLRPLFPKGFHHNLQTILTILSYDFENEHDMVAAVGASIAFTISDAPFEGPTATVRVGLIDDTFILNPTLTQKKESQLDLIVTSTEAAIVMIECKASEISEEKMLEAMEYGHEQGKKICAFINEIASKIGRKKIEFTTQEVDSRILPLIKERYQDQITETIFAEELAKLERFARFDDLKDEAVEILSPMLNSDDSDADEVSAGDIKSVFDKLMKETIRRSILDNEKRIKGRKLDEIRPLSVDLDIVARPHSSILFNRGETQALSAVTLGGPENKKYIVGMEGEEKVSYYHHYNFPPFSVGECNNRLMTGNREIGHGALAEKALLAVLPSEEEFPYTIRVVTEILSSNGSSSMAATCGSTLALMAAGVPIKSPVAGIAMGLMTDPETGVFKVLTDLQDEEDFGGDMDFKVAGTRDGLTAIQMDIKLKGIPMDVFRDAFMQAKKGRMEILDVMIAAIPEPRAKLSEHAPRLESIKIDTEMIRVLIGKGGETIQGITEETGVNIDIADDGLVTITGAPGSDMDKALKIIAGITAKPEVGKVYEGKVIKIMDFGAFVEILPKKEGLVHVSMMSNERVMHPSDVVKEGQMVKVKLLEIDSQGRLRLSMKDAV